MIVPGQLSHGLYSLINDNAHLRRLKLGVDYKKPSRRGVGSNFLQMVFYKFKGECIIRTPDILEIKKNIGKQGFFE